MGKVQFEKRVEKALCQKNLLKRDIKGIKNEVLKLVSECIKKEEINADPKIVDFRKINYESMPKDEDRGWTSLIFIQFTKNGFVAVVGAGRDIGYSYNSTTGKILRAIDEEWDEESLIIVPIEGLKSVGLKNVGSVLECRNGVETYIGDYLSANNIPILNYYQHWNYKKEIWEKWKKNNFKRK